MEARRRTYLICYKAFAKSSKENFLWFSVDLCPRLGSQDRYLIMSH